jgi:hypothetical protein
MSGKDKVSVKRKTINGKEYLIDKENIVYDPELKEAVGEFNKDTNTLSLYESDSE